MSTVTSQCVQCNAPLEFPGERAYAVESRCASCDVLQIQYVYPADARTSGSNAHTAVVDAVATCYFHGASGAENICDDCGRYLCRLCALSLPAPANNPPGFPTHVCPTCFAHRVDAEEREPAWDLFQTEYPRYDLIAVILASVPVGLLLTFILTPLTSSVALYIAIRNWRRCRNPVSRFRFYLIVTIGLVMFVALLWFGLIAMFVADITGEV
jgi:hypothetical protein